MANAPDHAAFISALSHCPGLVAIENTQIPINPVCVTNPPARGGKPSSDAICQPSDGSHDYKQICCGVSLSFLAPPHISATHPCTLRNRGHSRARIQEQCFQPPGRLSGKKWLVAPDQFAEITTLFMRPHRGLVHISVRIWGFSLTSQSWAGGCLEDIVAPWAGGDMIWAMPCHAQNHGCQLE